jgi:hypothetical protein
MRLEVCKAGGKIARRRRSETGSWSPRTSCEVGGAENGTISEGTQNSLAKSPVRVNTWGLMYAGQAKGRLYGS